MKMQLEELESRDVPSVALVGNNLVITGTPGNDTITVNSTNPGSVIIKDNGMTSTWALPPGGHVIINALAGADNVAMTGPVSLEAYGGLGNDTVTGGSGPDVIYGNEGLDLIQGGSGDDVLIGGSGRDRISGDVGNNILIGGEVTGFTYDQLRTDSDNWSNASIIDPALPLATTDTEVDVLTGGSGHDWYIAQPSDIFNNFNPGKGDVLTPV